MKTTLEIHHYFHSLPPASGSDLSTILEAINKGELAMSAALDRLTREVAETKDAVQAAKVSIAGMAQIIRDLKDDPAALEALADDLDAQQKDLIDAVVANTPTELPPTGDDTSNGGGA